MMPLVQFEPEHISQMSNFGGQESLITCFDIDTLKAMKNSGPCYTAIVDGKVIGCAGFVELHQYRALTWAILQKTSPIDFMRAHIAVRHVLKTVKYKRIEAFVDPKFYPAMRWVEAIGFKMTQAYIPFYFPDGSGASEWVYYKD